MFKYSNYQKFKQDLENDQSKRNQNIYGSYFDLVESEIIEDEKQLGELVESYSQIDETFHTLYEKREVLIKISHLLSNESKSNFEIEKNKVSDFNMDIEIGNIKELEPESELNFLAGLINADDELKMKRMIFRISKGRALSTFWNLNINISHEVRKSLNKNLSDISEFKKDSKRKIFTIFFQSGNENILLMKILKICDIFGASRYNIPKDKDIKNSIENINNEIKEKLNFLNQVENSISNFLIDKCGDSKYAMYKLFFRKEKMIYLNLNKCLLRDTFIDGEVWIPTKNIDLVNMTLRNVFKENESRLTATLIDIVSLKSNIFPTPPTYIPTNEFIWAFQEIVDTYGVPRYKEINPTYFNIITFPFLFGIMFGDIGHGSILFIFGIYLCMWKESIEKSNTNPFRYALPGRYLIAMMGFFALYCGLIYNDFFSVAFEAFGSCYVNNNDTQVIRKSDCVYPFGIDPKWNVATNELAFFNSFKMKFSVIIGVVHMLFGVVLRGLNSLYFKDYLDFYFQFIPQFIFMLMLFGYMDALIYIKWSTNWMGREDKAPTIINTMMNIFLKLGSVEEKPIWGGDQLYSGRHIQEWFHLLVLAVAFICVPILLFVKPYYENKKNQSNIIKYEKLLEENEINQSFISSNDNHSYGEILIHQLIETIEFVLGTVSNTASYLRLWALSLAHGQLSKVFFQRTILMGIETDQIYISIPILFISYFIFASVTFAVLMCMDTMECFLHTLRLHW